MTRADGFVLFGYVLLVAGAGMIYRPLALILAGMIMIQIAKAVGKRSQKEGGE